MSFLVGKGEVLQTWMGSFACPSVVVKMREEIFYCPNKPSWTKFCSILLHAQENFKKWEWESQALPKIFGTFHLYVQLFPVPALSIPLLLRRDLVEWKACIYYMRRSGRPTSLHPHNPAPHDSIALLNLTHLLLVWVYS